MIIAWVFVVILAGDADGIVFRETSFDLCQRKNAAAHRVWKDAASPQAQEITAITRCEPEFEPKSRSRQP